MVKIGDYGPKQLAARRGRPLAIDLFSGAGGLTLGLKQAGFKVIAAIECDSLAVETYRLNHRGTCVVEGDIRRVAASALMRHLRLEKGRLDLLAGCPPCQSFSSLNTLNRGRRVRNARQKDLLFEMCRFAKVLRPKAVMMENVPGLASDRRMRTFRKRLRRLGYTCHADVLNAAAFGVPQRRNRLIFLATRTEGLEWPQGTGVTATVADAIKGLPRPGKSGDPLHDVKEKRSDEVTAIIRLVPKNGGSRTSLGADAQLGCHQRCDGFYDIYGRMAWKEVSPTITSGFVNPSKGRFLHPRQNRAITLREAALLQSFPPGYRFSLRRGKYAAAAMIGNALPPKFIHQVSAPVLRHVSRGRPKSIR